METDEGKHKNNRAGRRSVWWRFQAKPIGRNLIGEKSLSMRNNALDFISLGLFLFLLGLCTGVSILGNRVQFNDVTGLVLAGSAVFGVMRWRQEIDYKERKTDRKNITRLMKSLDSASERAMERIGLPLEQLANVSRGKMKMSDISPQLILAKLGSSKETIDKLRELHYEIESEMTVNKIVQSHHDMNSKIHTLLLKNTDLVETLEKSYLIIKDGWWVNNEEKLGILIKLDKKINDYYQSYFRQYLKIEIELGIFNNTLSRHSSARKLGKL